MDPETLWIHIYSGEIRPDFQQIIWFSKIGYSVSYW